jgi:site-specific DNA-methyltransferase (adenine-specific)
MAEIGDVLDMSRSSIKDRMKIISDIGADILEKCKANQIGRAPTNGACAPFNFTEGWFRTSGLYELNEYYQTNTIDKFINDKGGWSKSKLQRETEKYKKYQEMESIVDDTLDTIEGREEIITDLLKNIRNGVFSNKEQLRTKIKQINEEAENRLINGDCIEVIKSLDDNSIDIIITDPPYGINYKSNRSKYKEHVTKEEIENDSEEALGLFKEMITALKPKLAEDAMIYVFIGEQMISEFKQVLSDNFTFKRIMPWNKGNHGAGDLKGNYGNKFEYILFAKKGNRNLIHRRDNDFNVKKLHSSKMNHPTEKPVALISNILATVAIEGDRFLDPFMGTGAHVKAAKDAGCSYIGIELDKKYYNKAKQRIEQ